MQKTWQLINSSPHFPPLKHFSTYKLDPFFGALMLICSQPVPDSWAKQVQVPDHRSARWSAPARRHFCPMSKCAGAVGCWCLCAPQLALVIRPQAGRPPHRLTPPRTPTPDDSVSSPTQPNLLILLLRKQKTEMYFMPLSSGPGVGFLRKARYYLSQYWLAIIQPHTQRVATMTVGMVKE